MKLRVIFKDRIDEVIDNATINWNKRVIEYSSEGVKGFIPFEAVFGVWVWEED